MDVKLELCTSIAHCLKYFFLGKQDYKKTKPILRATKLKAEAKKTAIGIKVSVFDNYKFDICMPFHFAKEDCINVEF